MCSPLSTPQALLHASLCPWPLSSNATPPPHHPGQCCRRRDSSCRCAFKKGYVALKNPPATLRSWSRMVALARVHGMLCGSIVVHFFSIGRPPLGPGLWPTPPPWQWDCRKAVKCPLLPLRTGSHLRPLPSWLPSLATTHCYSPYTHLHPNDIMVPGCRLLTPPLSPLSPLRMDSLVRMCHLT